MKNINEINENESLKHGWKVFALKLTSQTSMCLQKYKFIYKLCKYFYITSEVWTKPLLLKYIDFLFCTVFTDSMEKSRLLLCTSSANKTNKSKSSYFIIPKFEQREFNLVLSCYLFISLPFRIIIKTRFKSNEIVNS